MFSIPLTNWNSHRGSPEWLCQKIISSTGTFCSSSLGRHTLIRGSSSQPLNAPVAVRDWAWLLHAPTGRCFLEGSHTEHPAIERRRRSFQLDFNFSSKTAHLGFALNLLCYTS